MLTDQTKKRLQQLQMDRRSPIGADILYTDSIYDDLSGTFIGRNAQGEYLRYREINPHTNTVIKAQIGSGI